MLTLTELQRRAGRPTGRNTHSTPRDLREMVLGALHRVGGEKYLADRAIDTPGPFLTLLGKVLPTTVSNADGSPIALHLLAAQLVSKHILEMQIEPPPIVDVEQPQHHNLLDAPPPME